MTLITRKTRNPNFQILNLAHENRCDKTYTYATHPVDRIRHRFLRRMRSVIRCTAPKGLGNPTLTDVGVCADFIDR